MIAIAIAISSAIVLVALIARDVVLRVVAAGKGLAQLRHEHLELAEYVAQLATRTGKLESRPMPDVAALEREIREIRLREQMQMQVRR